ncbi:MAG TPA: ApbE family protein, partial [Gammaproteobacteria bacterium]|nr:ApbE family protein [Gammaproteobacteria bacterium]
MTFIAVITGFAVFFITMSVGVMMGRKPIAGSCGGLANVGLNGECKVCGRTP